MGKAKTIARRSFLIGSAAIVGGVAFGTYVVKKPHANPLLNIAGEGEAVFNPWVKISSDGITLITPHVDMGQGAYSMQAALIAEELDVEFGQFSVSPGTPSGAYYNTASGGELAPFMSTDQSFKANTMRNIMNTAVKLMGVQGTGGSSSVPDSYEKLRVAGAVARETLKLAAAKKTGASVKDLKTRNGAVHFPDGTEISYTELAEVAQTIKPVSKVTLKPASQWRLIGKPMQRLDIVAKSTGAPIYGIDLEFEDMVFAAVKTNPRQGGDMISMDATQAKNMRGVLEVVPLKNGAAIIANNTWRAFKAVEAIEFKWGAAPYPSEMDAHWAVVEESFTPERLDKEWRNDGDVDATLNDSDVIEAEYRAPYVAHQPLEPIGATIMVRDDRVDIWVGHQLPRFAQQKVAEITGHEDTQVFLHNQYLGGSFGHRLEFDNVILAAEIAKTVRDVPIKLTFSREEDFAHDYPRHIAMARNKGAVKDGKVDVFDIHIASVSSTASQSSRMGQSTPGADVALAAGVWNLPYAIPNFRTKAYKVPELAPTSSWRSVGASTAGFFAECFMDELCYAAGADPLEERLRLCSDDVARKVLEAVGEMSNWATSLEPNRGRGIAFINSFGVPTAEVVEVTMTPHGIKIDKVFVAADVGKIVDPINFDNMVKGGVVWGLGHAMNCEITYSDGMAEQSNYHAHEGMRLHQCPEIMVRGLENAHEIRGIGEPPVPPAAPALANAIFAATGKRIREMPFYKFINFV